MKSCRFYSLFGDIKIILLNSFLVSLSLSQSRTFSLCPPSPISLLHLLIKYFKFHFFYSILPILMKGLSISLVRKYAIIWKQKRLPMLQQKTRALEEPNGSNSIFGGKRCNSLIQIKPYSSPATWSQIETSVYKICLCRCCLTRRVPFSCHCLLFLHTSDSILPVKAPQKASRWVQM